MLNQQIPQDAVSREKWFTWSERLAWIAQNLQRHVLPSAHELQATAYGDSIHQSAMLGFWSIQAGLS